LVVTEMAKVSVAAAVKIIAVGGSTERVVSDEGSSPLLHAANATVANNIKSIFFIILVKINMYN